MSDYWLITDTYYLSPSKIIEGFKSMIWTERYNAMGDFKLTMSRTHPLANQITTQCFIGKNDSRYFMQVEKIEKDTTNGTISFSGRTADLILNYRPTVKGTLWPKWTINARPTGIAMQLVRNAIDGNQTYYEDMGFANITFSDISGGLGDVTNTLIPIDQTYNLMKKLCDSVNAGWRFLRPATPAGSMLFQIYVGTDRSASQNTRDAVLFDPELDNIEDVKSILSTEGYVTRLWAHQTYYDTAIQDNYYYETYYNNEPYYRPNTLPQGAWDVRYDHFDLEGTYDPTVNVPADVWNFYKAELSQKKVAVSIDGKVVPTSSSFKAGVDYFLGDLVSYRLDADTVDARVTEIITSIDETGEQVYPTLSFTDPSTDT
jgi:hypothetical protein